ncbi:MAG: tRNA-dihydrouridine synthase [Halobacteriaceae archaeon]
MFEPRLALASLSGQSDVGWAKQGSPYAGAAFLGGIAIDAETRRAAKQLIERDRNEFLPANPHAFIESQLAALDTVPLRPAINVRTISVTPLERVAEICNEYNAIIEINAHCRQEEMCSVGAGESLLADVDRLSHYVSVAAETGATVSVKTRAEVPDTNLCHVASAIESAGGEIIHVDAMDTESIIADINQVSNCFIIANNGVRDRDSAAEYLSYGADAVSVGRPSDKPRILEQIHQAVVDLTSPHP